MTTCFTSWWNTQSELLDFKPKPPRTGSLQVVLWLARDMLIEEIGLYHPTRDATVT